MAILSDEITRLIRVNQAGEYGATRIYAGQLAILKGKPAEKILTEMAVQEAGHLQQFNQLVVEHRVRPTLFQPLWHVGGYVLGMVTALMGEKAAHACTVAVEEVIDEHYQNQLDRLHDQNFLRHDPQNVKDSLIKLVESCRQDELAHKETAIQLGGQQVVGYTFLSAAIKTVSRAAIRLSTKL